MTTITNTIIERFEKQVQQDQDGVQMRELSLGCYECGNEMDIEGVKAFLKEQVEFARSELIKEVEKEFRSSGEWKIDDDWWNEFKNSLKENK